MKQITKLIIFCIICNFAIPVYADTILSAFRLTQKIDSIILINHIDKLKKNYEHARERENSTANKLLGAIGIGMTGIGTMQLMSGMAEKAADEDAEQQMRAYMATFRCNYGGLSHKGGEVGIELPAGDLSALKQEYLTLAADLKVRKESLDMQPGIESEEILDSATAGLYDDEHVGKTDGQYTSVYRALSDENSEDAAEFAAQKEDAQKKVKTGGIVAGVGAAGSLVGDLIINRDKDKESSDANKEK